MKIYISPSNQYGNLYAWGGTNEEAQCNRIAECLEVHLLRNGFEVKRAPKSQDMMVSINESNNWGADLHVPIHTNAGGGHGPLVMVYSMSEKNLQYAGPVYNNLKEIAPMGGGYGVRLGTDMTAGNYMPAELRLTNAIGVYCECEFHDQVELAKWIVNDVAKIAEAIAKGICKGAGKEYKGEDQPEPKPEPSGEIKEGSIVKLLDGAKYTNGKTVPPVILAEEWIVDKVTETKALLNKSVSGQWAINSWVYKKYMTLIKNPSQPSGDIIYIVKPGDTLSSIAAQYGMNFYRLADYNGIGNPNLIFGGQKIKIPRSEIRKG